MTPHQGEVPWWQRTVIYQVFVRSFKDTNGDGNGDLPGLTEKLDYLNWLGVGAVWLSPIHPSPMEDAGYDVTDFQDVNPMFGTLEDFDRFLAEAHKRDIRVILDWVPNHTSSEHAWFKESRSSRENPKRDWYVWRDPAPDGGVPNNWISIFGDTAWQWDEVTGQHYLHTFLSSQPDLNWRHPEVREAMTDTLRFWLDRGVDGFRIDAIDLLIEDDQFRDNPPNPDYDPNLDGPDQKLKADYTRDQPYLHEVLAELRRVTDSYRDRLLAGEMYLSPEQVVAFYGQDDRPELHLPLNLQPAWTPWNADQLTGMIEKYMSLVPQGKVPTWTFGTHDAKRLATRAEGDHARLAAMLLLTLPGTPTLYYGDEIGMRGTDIPPEEQEDPQGKRIGRSRDPFRTPMQWDAGSYAGFSTGQPWLPIAPDFDSVNVNRQSHPGTLLELYRRLLRLRREVPGLVTGRFVPAPREAPLIAYRSESDSEQYLVVLNLGDKPVSYKTGRAGGQVLISTFLDREGEEVRDMTELRAVEGVVLHLQ